MRVLAIRITLRIWVPSLLTRGIGIVKSGGVHLGSEFVECLTTCLIPSPLVGEQILEANPAMGSDLVERKFAGFQQVHEVLPGDAEIVRGGLGSEGFILGNEDDSLAFGHQSHDAGEVGEKRFRNEGPAPLLVDQCNVIRFGEDPGQFGKFVFAKKRRVEAIGAGAEHGGNRVHRSGDDRKVTDATFTTNTTSTNDPPLNNRSVSLLGANGCP